MKPHIFSPTSSVDTGIRTMSGWSRWDVLTRCRWVKDHFRARLPVRGQWEVTEHYDDITPPGLQHRTGTAANAQGPPPLWVTLLIPECQCRLRIHCPMLHLSVKPAAVSDKLLDSLSILLPPAPL